MSNRLPVPITRLQPGAHFDFGGTHGQVIERLPDRVKVMLREKPPSRAKGWVWREALWPVEMRVIPDLPPR